MSGAGTALLHHHGVSVRGTLPHGDCRFLPGACFLSDSPISDPMSLSLVCSASPNNHRPRNLDMSRQQKGILLGGKANHTKKEMTLRTSMDLIYSDIMLSKNEPPISLASNSRPQATSTPGEREKEIVELFKRVQAQLRARGKGREDKKPEPAKAQGERGSVDSLLNLLRKHSVDQRRKNSDEKEQNFDQTRRSNDSGNKQNSRISVIKNDTEEEQKPPPAFFKRPASNFRRRSPVPRVKFQPVTNADAEADAKSIANSMADAVLKDDESDTDESNEYLEPSLENPDVTNSNAFHDKSLECSSAEGSDISSLKVTELRELAKSRGIKGYAKLKNELVEVLSSMHGLIHW